MQLRVVVFLSVCATVLYSRSALGSEVTDASDSTVNGCIGSDKSVIAIVNASNNYLLDTVTVNCLAFSDSASTISLGIVSHIQGVTQARSTIQCVNNVLVVSGSSNLYDTNMTSCYECEDSTELDTCPNDAECGNLCRSCFGPNQADCLVCNDARYNNTCIASCPGATIPNYNNGNECECPGNFGGINCTDCLLTKYNCSNQYYFDESACSCSSCPAGFVLELVDHDAVVPQSVIGSPEGEECYEEHERRRSNERRATEGSHGEEGGSLLDQEELRCEEHCELEEEGWRANSNTDNVCYACGIRYCLECNTLRQQCEKCREGTLLSEISHNCVGFYEEICELAREFEHEVEVEEEGLKEYQLHLKIALPIVCTFVVIVFLLFAVIAHFRYPHVGHQKRHRKPNKITEKKKTDFEKVLRPQSTVIFR